MLQRRIKTVGYALMRDRKWRRKMKSCRWWYDEYTAQRHCTSS